MRLSFCFWMMFAVPALARAESAIVLPLRTEVAVSAEQAEAIRVAQEQALKTQGVDLVASGRTEVCGDQQCVAAMIADAAAQHAVELALWRSPDGRISGVSTSIVLSSGERFSEGAAIADHADLGGAIARSTRGAYARLRRGPGPWLELVGTPEGAEITVDDRLAGALPQRIKVPGGLHRVRVAHAGFETFEQAVTVPRNIDALKQVAIELQALPVVQPEVEYASDAGGSAWRYVLGGAGLALAAVLAVGPVKSAARDGECGQTERNTCTGVVAFDTGEGIQLAAAALFLGAGITVAIWEPF